MEARIVRREQYQRDRRKFACICYTLTLGCMLLALIQWLLVCLIADIAIVFLDFYWISLIFFIMAMILASVFIYFEILRSTICLNWVICLLIVEFIIIGVFNLVAFTHWKELLVWFFVCMLLVFLFILLGSIVPHDLTLDVVILFVMAFIFLIITIFFAMVSILTKIKYSFIVYEVFISIVVLMFVMYHAQTINGGRFAEMRIHDHLLAALILFHDFIILFLLTFFQQLVMRCFVGKATTMEPSLNSTTTESSTTAAVEAEG